MNRRLWRPFANSERRTDRAVAALPDFADVVTVGIRAGLHPATALIEARVHAAAPLAAYVDDLSARLQRGERLADALRQFGESLGGDAITFADTLGTAARYGLPLEPVLDRLVADSRDARRRRADRYARTLPVRLAFPLVLCTLPGFVLCAIAPALLGALETIGDLTP